MQQSFATARQRMAAILALATATAIFDTRHPVAQRADLAAMIGTSRVMMYRTLRGLEADGLVKRHRGGGISIVDHEETGPPGRGGRPGGRARSLTANGIAAVTGNSLKLEVGVAKIPELGWR